MKLLEMSCVGIRGVPDGAFRFADPRTGEPLPVVIVTGEATSGKTSLLDAIAAAKEAIGAYGGPPDVRRLRRSGVHEARIVTTWRLSDAEREHVRSDAREHAVTWDLTAGVRADAPPALRRLFAEFSRAPGLGKLEYFPSNRALRSSPRAAFGRPSRDAETRSRAVRAADKYACLIEGLHDAALEEAGRATREPLREGAGDALAPFRAAVAKVVPHLRLSAVDLTGGVGLRFARGAHEDIALDELSDSEQQGVLFALTFVYFGLHDAVVLIDEPELHVHSADRVRMLEAITALGRDNQFIVATGATELVQGVERGNIIELAEPRAAVTRPAPSNLGGGATAIESMSTLDVVVSASVPAAPATGVAGMEAQPPSVPSRLRAPPVPPAMVTMPPSVGEATLEIQGGVLKPALPFIRAGRGDVTEELPAPDSHSPAGKRLVRFDPQTGQPLAKPVWVDTPQPSSTRK